LAIEHDALSLDRKLILKAAQLVLEDSSYPAATISIAVVDDPTIHELNVEFLDHDYPTDVLSFVLEEDPAHLEGEIVVSADTALREAAAAHWPPERELLLYVLHGILHLVGYRDKTVATRKKMLAAEARYLELLGIPLPVGNSRWNAAVRPKSRSKSSAQSREDAR
jgi:probable rRNA maturation factor